MSDCLQMISTDSIVHGELFNHRKDFYEERIIGMRRENIRETGKLKNMFALHVRPVNGNQFQVIDGNLRLMVCKELGIKEVPCYVEEMSDADAIINFIVENTSNGVSELLMGLAALKLED